MTRKVIQLRVHDHQTLVLELPNPDGTTTVVQANPAEVQEMYAGLQADLPRIFTMFEDPRAGQMPADFPYPAAEQLLSSRVPADILSHLDGAAGDASGGEPPVLLINERDPFPWELVRSRPNTRMLGQIFEMARFDGVCTGPTIEVAGMLVVAPAPTSDLGQCDVADGDFRRQHEDVIRHFTPDRCELLDCVSGTQSELLNRLRRDDQRVVHYMGHHYFDAADPAQSWLQLAQGERISPADVTDQLGMSPSGPKWPWVFLNCCKAGAVALPGDAFGEAGTRWGTVLRTAGAHVVIGPYWRVKKDESYKPAVGFAQHVLTDGWTVGAAMRAIRSIARPSTQIAYTLVGDPTTRVRIAA